ncbi:MAG: DUF2147 domain-containing protein [Fibrobacteres bacterium]|nr:DUF2147 domain-containing protein [Fibrobacterota bacterium]
MRLWPVLLLAAASFASAQGLSPEGWWKTVDDKTGRVKSIVHITRGGDTLSGKIEKLFRRPEEIQDPVCIKCSGERKDKRIVGMTIMWGLHPSGAGWDGGSVLDPANGKVYSCKLSLSEDSQSLTVRGYLGFSLLGRSQTWKRVLPEEVGKAVVPGS